ncbi:FitA-like ribbon-helix-helix domain-containing protein [Methylobacterium sp. Leaf100]|uniref:FitA-like ribbon-helix-helix domain-containing protein n=1 Tax=unclassified Methylobacterium TaxID=2615210 RepID=UPI0006FEAA29|nr:MULTISPECIES: hypothetical protein [unclassified Methylobacterium]KQP35005.1 hypothetical protein ASF25_14180 [Methylobacterium sp. Leaf100]KQP59449.1 hypothetical protein ASF52_11000 [Methylobacterium sp. Leaf112]
MPLRSSQDSLTIRNLDPGLKERLRVRAARNGQSMQAEARHILEGALGESNDRQAGNLYERIRARFAPLGSIEIDVPARGPPRDPPVLE